MKSQDVVFSGIGTVTSQGCSVEAILDYIETGTTQNYSLKSFKAAPYMSDKRMLKAVSNTDAYGLAAAELLTKDSGFQNDQYESFRKAVFVGAPPASPWDNENYLPAMRETIGPDGTCQIREFGKTSMGSRPTTLLLGLPNNVLCYTSIITESRGPNSNYTSGETSGMLAIGSAARSIERGRADCAIAGGFSGLDEPIFKSMYQQNGLMSMEPAVAITPYEEKSNGTIFADGAVFYLMERRSEAEAHGRKPIATFVASSTGSESSGVIGSAQKPPVLADAITRCLRKESIRHESIGLVFTAGCGIYDMDQAELSAVEMCFDSCTEKPAVTTLSPKMGNLLEAGGLLEIALAQSFYKSGGLPEALPSVHGYSRKIIREKPYVLIVRTTILGDINVMLVKMDGI